MNDKDIKKLIGAMKEVFPTAEMVARWFEDTASKADMVGVKKDIAEMKC